MNTDNQPTIPDKNALNAKSSLDPNETIETDGNETLLTTQRILSAK
jgi:hypothetical protein